MRRGRNDLCASHRGRQKVALLWTRQAAERLLQRFSLDSREETSQHGKGDLRRELQRVKPS